MVEVKYNGDALWERIEKAGDSVKDRLRRVCEALDCAEVPYAVIGDNAVQFWVAQVDRSVVRNTQNVAFYLTEATCLVPLRPSKPLVSSTATPATSRCSSMVLAPEFAMLFT